MKNKNQEVIATDQKNQKTFDELVQSCGWPNRKEHSFKANLAAFFIVQHGNAEYRVKYFPYLKKQYETNELTGSRFALLIDRMRLEKGMPQLYGTQFYSNKAGIEVYGDVEEPEKLNIRREEMGLSVIDIFEEKYGKKDQTLNSSNVSSQVR